MHGALPASRDRPDSKANGSLFRLPRANLRIPSTLFYALTVLIFLAAYARHSSHDKHDPFKCHAVLNHGQWLDPPATQRSGVPFRRWQPNGCMLRTYNAKAISRCLGSGAGTDAIFIGDSTVREVFWAMARKLDHDAAEHQLGQVVQRHANVQFEAGASRLDFVWDPFLNSSQLMTTLDASRSNAEHPNRIALPSSKALVVVGGGLWYARLDNGVEQFKNAIDKVADPAHQFHHSDIVDNPGANRVFIMPVQPPYYKLLDAEHSTSLRPKDIDAMNKYMRDLTFQYEVDILLSFLDMEGSAPAYQPSGLHVTKTVAEQQSEVILNARCNNDYQAYPYSGTCCFDYPATFPQVGLVFFGFVALLLMLLLESSGRYIKTPLDTRLDTLKQHLPFMRPFLVLWAALYYCYLADRTHLFNKVTKQYNNEDFFIFCIGIGLAGFLTIRRSITPIRPGQEKAANQSQPFLSRDQTDEWKGWMQALILAYHYTGASKILWIYKIVRLLVASYLFMTGYGHAAYFYQKKDFSLKRVIGVNLRVNLLSVLLPWMMDSDYLFYYFAPLVTYWYAVIYLTMRVKSSWNENLPFFLIKIVSSAAITTFLHTQPALLSPLFTAINTIFGAKWDAKEWLFRCALDQYIVYVGMIVAVMYIRESHPPAPPAPPVDPIGNTSHRRPGSPPNLRKQLFFLFDAVAITIYLVASSTRGTKSSSNALHTYISPLAILAFIHLRNATPALRNSYSSGYAWLGRISLETFILQYHLWLAADTRGLLSLGIFGSGGMSTTGGFLRNGMGFGRWTDCIVLGLVFVWTSSKVANATGGVTATAMKMMFK